MGSVTDACRRVRVGLGTAMSPKSFFSAEAEQALLAWQLSRRHKDCLAPRGI
jgi:hypothetical protein